VTSRGERQAPLRVTTRQLSAPPDGHGSSIARPGLALRGWRQRGAGRIRPGAYPWA
jgi:hypothetical protein